MSLRVSAEFSRARNIEGEDVNPAEIVNQRLTHKIKTVREVADRFGKHATRPRILVQCHGVFDLLHIGHIRHLQQARQLGDCLVVTITPDRFVNKGPHRPAFDENLRAEALAALACVDFVCINEWPTAVEAVRMICPDVYLKGSVRGAGPRDRNSAIDLEREAVESIGGRLVLTDTELHSSSALINRHTNVLPPRLQAYLEEFRGQPAAGKLVEEIAGFKNLRVLVVGESYAEVGGRHSERYAGGALAVANVLSSFCNQVALITAGVGDEMSDGFLQKNVADEIKLEISNSDESRPREIEQLLDRNLDRCDLVLLSDHVSGFASPRAQAMIRERSACFAVDTRSRNSESNAAQSPCAADLVVQSEPEGQTVCRGIPGSRLPPNRDETISLAESIAQASECKRVVMVRGDAGVVVYDAPENVCAEVPAFPVNQANRVDLLGTREALFALTAACTARGFSASATGFVGNIACAAASTIAGSGRKLDPASIFRHIDSLLK